MTDRHEVPLRPLRVVMFWMLPLWLSGCADSEGVPRAGPAEAAGSSAERTDTSPAPSPRFLADGGPRSDVARARTTERAEPMGGTPEDVIVIPAGTTMRARLDHGISPGANGAGDRFIATVADEVLAADGMVLVPEGARLAGTVRWLGSTVDPGSSEASGVEAETLPTEGERARVVPELVVDRLLVEGEHVPLEARGLVAVEEPGLLDEPSAPSPDPSPTRSRTARSDLGQGSVPAGALIEVQLDGPASLTPR